MASSIPGGFTVTDDVIMDMVGYAALASYGVVGMAAPTLSDGIAKLLPQRSLRRGIDMEKLADGLRIDLFIVVEHGTNMAEVSRMLAENVRYALEDSAQLPVESVNVHVQGVKVRNS